MSETTQFGPFRLERRLGRGGMAETFAATREGPGEFRQRLCVKRILPAFERDRAFVEMFIEEARLSARLHHGGIAQVLDFGIASGSHYLALELIEGTDLRALLRHLSARGQRMSSDAVAYLAFEIGSALGFAHAATECGRARGVVHRDISPSNILLSDDGEVKLTDFGIAKAMDLDPVTRTATVKGKIPYMAPEYATEGRFDARSDLFALGVTLFECMAGRRPFDGEDDMETLRRARSGEHPPLAALAPTMPAGLIEIVERMIHPDPNARCQTAESVLDAIVALAPSMMARGELARLVMAVNPASEARAGASPLVAYADTQPRRGGSPGGTLVMSEVANDGARDPALPSPRPARPDAVTRTRPPSPNHPSDEATKPPRDEIITRAPRRRASRPKTREGAEEL